MLKLFAPGVKAKTEVVDNKDGTYTVTYIPLTSGMYTLLLRYGGKAVPGFPAKVMADPAVDTSKIKVFGPGVEGRGAVWSFCVLLGATSFPQNHSCSHTRIGQ